MTFSKILIVVMLSLVMLDPSWLRIILLSGLAVILGDIILSLVVLEVECINASAIMLCVNILIFVILGLIMLFV